MNLFIVDLNVIILLYKVLGLNNDLRKVHAIKF